MRDDGSRFPLANDLVLLEVKVQVVSVAVLEHRAERVGVNLEDVKEADNPRMVQLFVDVVLSKGVLDVVGLLVVLPVLVQLVDLAGHVALLLEVKGFVHLTESALAEQHEQQIPLVEHRMVIESALVLVVDPLEFADVQIPLPLQFLHLELQVAVLFLEGVLLQLEDLFRLVVLLDVELAVKVVESFERLSAVEEARRAARGVAPRLAVAAATAHGGRPLPTAAGGSLCRGFPLAEKLPLPVNLFSEGAQLFLTLGQLLEGVAVRPVLLERGAYSLRDKLAEPEPVLHAPGSRLLLFDRRLFDEEPLDDVDALLDGSLLLLHHLLLGSQFGGQLLVGAKQLVDPALLLLQIDVGLARICCDKMTSWFKVALRTTASCPLLQLTGRSGR